MNMQNHMKITCRDKEGNNLFPLYTILNLRALSGESFQERLTDSLLPILAGENDQLIGDLM